jgi:hypothetical protein
MEGSHSTSYNLIRQELINKLISSKVYGSRYDSARVQ